MQIRNRNTVTLKPEPNFLRGLRRRRAGCIVTALVEFAWSVLVWLGAPGGFGGDVCKYIAGFRVAVQAIGAGVQKFVIAWSVWLLHVYISEFPYLILCYGFGTQGACPEAVNPRLGKSLIPSLQL